MAESREKSEREVAIESFVDRVKELHPNLDREEFYDTISRYVQEYVTDDDRSEEEEEKGLMDKAKDKLSDQ
jgi:lipoate-protein ligase A